MSSTKRRRRKLMAVYNLLQPFEQILLQLCSFVYEPTTSDAIFGYLKKLHEAPLELNQLNKGSLTRYLKKLQSLELLDARHRCDEAIVEILTRRALASGQFEAFERATREMALPPRFYAVETEALCYRLMHKLRIGLYSNNLNSVTMAYQNLQVACEDSFLKSDPLAHICNNPFDPKWFRTLPWSLQSQVLRLILSCAIYDLEPDAEALDYALEKEARNDPELKHDHGFHYWLILRLLLGCRLEQADEILTRSREYSYSAGLQGSRSFLAGEDNSAIKAFDTDLKELRRGSRKRNKYFSGVPGLFYILSLLRSGQPSRLQKADQLLPMRRSKKEVDASLLPAYHFLQVLLHILSYDDAKARSIFRSAEQSGNAFSLLFSSLAAYWLDGTLNRERTDALSLLFIRAREAGINWVAMEVAELLCRTEQETPIRRNFIRKIQRETGIGSFISDVEIEEPWRRNLRALTLSTGHAPDPKQRICKKRLVWLIDFRDQRVSIQAKEQKITAKGSWSKGRRVALSRLYSGNGLDFMSPRDQAIRDALDKISSYYSDYYDFNLDRLLPALIGHPLVFLESSPTIPIEVVRGKPEVLVTGTGSSIFLELAHDLPAGRTVMVRETPTRFKVIELSDEQHRIAQILGSNGLTVPASAKDEVLDAITAISSALTVHSSIGGVAGEVVQIEADPTPHVHLLPAGAGFVLEMFVKPFPEGGPYLKAGEGTESVITELNGKKIQARRDLKTEEEMAVAVENACPVLLDLPDIERQWVLAEPEECLQVLLSLKTLQEEGRAVVFWPEGEKLKVTKELSFDRLRMTIRSRADWFEVNGTLQVDDDLVVDMKQLLDLMRNGKSRFIPLGDGQFLTLTSQLRKRLKELDAFSQGRTKSIRLHPLAALAMEGLTESMAHLDVDAGWNSRLRQIHSTLESTPALPSTLKAELRDYQAEGYTWLARLSHLGFGACLADDMGLGKTVQTLAVILARAERGPSLVVAPTSVCLNWADEVERFAPTLRAILLGGNNRKELIRKLGDYDLLICSYGLLHQEAELLASIDWNAIVLDEAQAIKNARTKRAGAAMRLNGSFRVITTGTPIENHLGELWSLFNFINPGLLGSLQNFNERFAVPIEKNHDREARERLKKLIQPFILRRTKDQVLEELPPRTDVTLHAEMTPREAAFYEALRQQALEKLAADQGPEQQKHVKILAEITRLRQAACNPSLIVKNTNTPSAKLELFEQVVSELLENHHKALVFSQFVGHLTLIREALGRKGIDYRYIDGATPAKKRKQEVDAFQAGHGDLFLISLKAGGLGLNLTAADYVIHMDPWWNPAVEDQASDRAHRIGQQHPVTVYRLVVRQSIEEKIVKLHREKRDLAGSLLDGSDISGKISAEELLQLIQGEM